MLNDFESSSGSNSNALVPVPYSGNSLSNISSFTGSGKGSREGISGDSRSSYRDRSTSGDTMDNVTAETFEAVFEELKESPLPVDSKELQEVVKSLGRIEKAIEKLSAGVIDKSKVVMGGVVSESGGVNRSSSTSPVETDDRVTVERTNTDSRYRLNPLRYTVDNIGKVLPSLEAMDQFFTNPLSAVDRIFPWMKNLASFVTGKYDSKYVAQKESDEEKIRVEIERKVREAYGEERYDKAKNILEQERIKRRIERETERRLRKMEREEARRQAKATKSEKTEADKEKRRKDFDDSSEASSDVDETVADSMVEEEILDSADMEEEFVSEDYDEIEFVDSELVDDNSGLFGGGLYDDIANVSANNVDTKGGSGSTTIDLSGINDGIEVIFDGVASGVESIGELGSQVVDMISSDGEGSSETALVPMSEGGESARMQDSTASSDDLFSDNGGSDYVEGGGDLKEDFYESSVEANEAMIEAFGDPENSDFVGALGGGNKGRAKGGGFGAGFSNMANGIMSGIGGVAEALPFILKGAIVAAVAGAIGYALDRAATVLEELQPVINTILSIVNDLWTKLIEPLLIPVSELLKTVLEGIKDIITPLFEALEVIAIGIKDVIVAVVNGLSNFFKDPAGFIGNIITGAFDAFKKLVTTLVREFRMFLPSWLGGYSDSEKEEIERAEAEAARQEAELKAVEELKNNIEALTLSTDSTLTVATPLVNIHLNDTSNVVNTQPTAIPGGASSQSGGYPGGTTNNNVNIVTVPASANVDLGGLNK